MNRRKGDIPDICDHIENKIKCKNIAYNSIMFHLSFIKGKVERKYCSKCYKKVGRKIRKIISD